MTIHTLSEHNTASQQWLTRGPCIAFDPTQSIRSPSSPRSTAPEVNQEDSPMHPSSTPPPTHTIHCHNIVY